jgi:hypothetical protein
MLLHKKSLYAVCGLFVLGFPLTVFAQNGRQSVASNQTPLLTVADQANQSTSPATAETAFAELPDSPGAVRSQTENPSQQQAGSSTTSQPQPQSDSASSITLAPQSQEHAAPVPTSPQNKQQRPVGTAAAETPMVSGTTAAQPAGFAIAPAKQHRVRTLVIKVGAIAGAAVALGTTMALTMATPSKPPVAH